LAIDEINEKLVTAFYRTIHHLLLDRRLVMEKVATVAISTGFLQH